MTTNNATQARKPKSVKVVDLICGKTIKGKQKKEFQEVFGELEIYAFDTPHATTPKVNPNYVYDLGTWQKAIAYIRRIERLGGGPGVMSAGMPGTGKSELWRQFAAITNRPFFETTGRDDFELYEITGRMVPSSERIEDPNDPTNTTVVPVMEFSDGVLLQALELEYAIFLFEEFDRCRPEVSVNFNTMLDGYGFTVNDLAQTFDVAKGFAFIATSNSNGTGDQSGVCHTSQPIDASTMNRFELIEHFYLPIDDQVKIGLNSATLPGSKAPEIPEPVIRLIAQYGESINKMFTGGSGARVPMPFTLRDLKSFINQMFAFPQGAYKSPHSLEQRWKDWIDFSYLNKVSSSFIGETSAIREAVYEAGMMLDLDAAVEDME